ncbi:peptidylprolyl isomerase [Aliidiomarina indica]|uniref:peptidylprolyl isomerase n=1 Tax=Aliidiomarina indica TaxID=2749147 RepID=UPI001890340F|nr:peptidylprolyl isomerase [Aliidiomarina indica]
MIQVNDTTITEQAISEETQYHPADSKDAAMKQAAEALIIGALLKQRARELGIKVTSAKASAAEHDYIEQLIDKDVHIPQADDHECEQYFRGNKDRFTTSPLLEVRHILIAAAPDDSQARMESLAMAEAVIEKLNAGGDFNGLARDYSACPSKSTGGSLGQLSRGQTVPEFERVVFALEPGLYNSPVESRYGFHVVWVERKIPGQPLEYAQVKDKIRDYLNEKVRHKAIAQYIQTLIVGAEIKGYEFALDESPLMQ